MITKVELKNIKSHLDTTLEFGPHLNVIAGESDEGKSNIYRAIYWVLENKPIGWNPAPWAKLKPKGRESRATVYFSDGNVIARVRTPSKNYYEVNGDILQGMRGGVPEQVAQIVNMNTSNTQPQKDMFFLLDDTAGSVAKKINEVAELGEMDAAMVEAKSRVTGTESDLKDVKAEIADHKVQVEQLQWVDPALAGVQVLIDEDIRIKKEWAHKNDLEAHVKRLTEAQVELSQAATEDFFLDFAGVKQDATTLRDKQVKKQRWQELIDSVVEFSKELQECMPNAQELADQLNAFTDRRNTITEGYQVVSQLMDARDNLVDWTGKAGDGLPAFIPQRMKEFRKRLDSLNDLKSVEEVVNKNLAVWREITEQIVVLDTQIGDAVIDLEKVRGEMEVCPICQTDLT